MEMTQAIEFHHACVAFRCHDKVGYSQKYQLLEAEELIAEAYVSQKFCITLLECQDVAGVNSNCSFSPR